MLRTMVLPKEYSHDPARRGYGIVYRRDETNHCPGCGRTHWYVGRVSAECGFCSTALPLAEVEYGCVGRREPWKSGRAAIGIP